MRRFLAVLAVLALLVTAVVPALAQERSTIPEWLTNDGRFTTLLAAVEAAGLGETLAGEGPFTVFAPTDDAFTAALESMGLTAEDVLADTETLTRILAYHVVPGRYFFRNLTSGPELETLEGGTIDLDLTDGVFTVNGVNILDVDNIASNGVVHVLEDGVLLPADLVPAAQPTAEPTPVPTGEAATRPSLLEWLADDADGRFTTLLAAVEAAGLGETLAGEGPFTLFAPTNDAITAALESAGMTAEALVADTETLTRILAYHVVPGRYFFRNLTSGPELETLEGGTIDLDLTDGVFTVNGVNILDVDNIVSNGVVHVLEDGVLFPADLVPAAQPTAEPTAEPTPAPTSEAATRPSLLEWLADDADGRFTTLLAAVEAAGLGDALAGEGPFTVFAPTNDAFTATLDFLGVSAEDLLANTELLTSILSYHVVPGQYFFRNLTSGPELETLEGSTVDLNLADGVFSINGLGILDVDNVASNGIVHIIEDGVLVPPGAFPNGHVRAAHFSPDAPAVDVYINGEVAASNVAFGTIGDWVEVPFGTHSIAFAPAGTSAGEAVATVDVAVRPNDWVTVVAIGSAANGTLTAQAIPEDFSNIPESQAQLTVFHAVEGAPAVNITANGAVIISSLGYPGTLGDNDGVFTLNVPAGTVNLAAVSGGAALVSADGLELGAGLSHFVAIIGTPDSPSLAISVTEPSM